MVTEWRLITCSLVKLNRSSKLTSSVTLLRLFYSVIFVNWVAMKRRRLGARLTCLTTWTCSSRVRPALTTRISTTNGRDLKLKVNLDRLSVA